VRRLTGGLYVRLQPGGVFEISNYSDRRFVEIFSHAG
jgi:hypothetical protein